jgi:single-strand DNA-binding protein
MYDISNITVVGNALNTPEWRRFERTNALVANFKIASTSRRFDKQNNRWIDGDNLRVRVNCWRRLAEGVVASIRVGDPVIVCGRLYTRDWTTESGERRSTYELEAHTVGHDLSRGIAAFKRGRINVNTTMVEDSETDKHVKGERTEAAPEENARSEAAAISLNEELRTNNNPEFPAVGFDGPVNAERVSMEDLQSAVASEMKANLARVIAQAEEKLGGGAGDEPAAINPTGPIADETGEETDDGTDDGTDDVAASVPEPVRNRRTRQKVGANA